VALLEGDVPDPEPQAPLLDRWGREVAHADLGYRRWRVAVEYEGRQHAERRQFRKDLDRYSLMAADGWLLLRFGDVHLGRPGIVVDRVARALRSRGATW
jgi:very-short-patch-repair endonuclease